MKKQTKQWILPGGIVILHEDRDLIVVDKPPGLLAVGTAKEKSRTVYSILSDYVKTIRKGAKIFVVHRLDRDTSGILVYAKNERVKLKLQNDWERVKKRYLAVVHGRPKTTQATLTDVIAESGSHRVYITGNQSEGKPAQMTYTVIHETPKFTLLEVELLTGRKHQIRVQLGHAGLPILGDRKYGIDDTFKKRMALHAFSLDFIHPVTGKPCHVETIIPPFFRQFSGERTDSDAS